MPVQALKEQPPRSLDKRVVGRWDDLLRERDEVMGAMEGLAPMARLWSRDADGAADLLQETAERALRGLHRYRRGSNASAWVRAIMYHLAVDQSRRRCREWALRADFRNVLSVLADHDGSDLEMSEGRTELPHGLDEVRAAALSLRDPVRSTFLLWLDAKLSYREIAQRQGVPCNTVATRLLRAREKIRRMLEVDGDPEDLSAAND